MKRIYKTRLSRIIALTLTFCMVFHMMPLSIFADDITTSSAINLEIQQLEQKVQDLESEVEDLLGMPLSDIFSTPAAIESDEPVTEPVAAMLRAAVVSDDGTVTQDYVVDEATIGTFTFDVASQTITKYTASAAPPDGELVIPSTITVDEEEVQVLAVGNGSSAIMSTTIRNISHVIISEGIETINNNAFNGLYVTQITLPKTVTTLGSWSLRSYNLTSVNFPASLTSIGESAFQGTKLVIADLSETQLIGIPKSLFNGCTSLTEVVLPGTITSIGDFAFSGCTALTSINLPAGITTIGPGAFKNCSKLVLDASTLNGMTGLTTIGSNAFENVPKLTGDLVLPTSLTSLGTFAFSATGLTSADFSNTNLTAIPGNLMQSAPSLTSILLPPAVESIGSYAFSDTALTALTLPGTVTTINSSAFQNTELTTLHIPASVTTIDSYAFNGVPLTTLTFEDGERSKLTIGTRAFYGSLLTSLTLPDIGSTNSLTLRGNSFSGTTEQATLTTLVFQNCNLTASSAFQYQPLVNITMPPETTKICDYMFQNVPLTNTDFLTDFDITSIGSYAFQNCSQISTLPDFPNLTTIGDSAFYNCSALTAAPNMANATSIGTYAFYNCDSLTSLALYATGAYSTLSLGSAIIADCDNLTTLNFHGAGNVIYSGSTPTTVYNSVSGGPFSGNSSVTTIHWSEEMTQVGTMLFANCSFVKNIDFLPETVYSLGDHAFNGSGLTELTIPANISYLSAGVFTRCSALESLTVENSFDVWNTASASRYYFAGVDFAADGGEPNITLPDDWTSIPKYMFYYSGLTSIDFLADISNVTALGAYAFSYCTELLSINLPSNITSIGGRAFYNSLDQIESLTIPATVTELLDVGSIYQQFYDSNSPLMDVYILNPTLVLNADTLSSSDDSRIFYYGYSVTDPLRIHSVMDSTAYELCDASNGIYLFSAIDASGVITVSVMDGETDLTEQCTIHWMDADGNSLGNASQLTPVEAGISYTYEIRLPEKLLTKYYIPEGGGVTSTTQAQEIIVNLVPISTTSFTGTVFNAAGERMPWAGVNVTQIVNGIELELYTYTDEHGDFTIGTSDAPALDVYTEVLVSYTGYFDAAHVYQPPLGEASDDLRTFTMNSLPATTVVLKVNAVLDNEPYVMYDLTDLTFSVTKKNGTSVESTLQDNTLVLTTSGGITLDSNELLYLTVDADPSVEAVAPSEPIEFYLRDNTVDVNLTSWGRISVTTGPVDIETDPGQYFWIYDSDGQLCYSDTLHYLNDNDTDRFTGESDLLPNGTYTVVLIDRTFPMENVSHLDILSDFGVISDIHYYSKTVTVTDGVTTALDGISVPSFMDNGGDDLFADMFESILIDINHAKPIVGQVYYLYIDYELKEEYSDSSTKTFTVQLPRNTKLMSSYLPGGVGSAVMNETTCVATVNTTANNGRIYFELRSIEADALAVVNVTLSKGTDFGRPVSHKLPILSVSIEPYPEDTTYYKEYWADVRSTPGTTVYLYKDGSLVGTETTNALGTATFQFSLADRNEFGSYWKPLDGTTWDLTAKSILDDRTVLETLSPVTVTYDPDPFDIRIKLPGTVFRGDPIFIYNDPYNSPTSYSPSSVGGWSSLEGPYYYLWEATVAEGMGQYIKDGILYITKGYGNSVNPGHQVPLYRTSETSDTFRGTTTTFTGGSFTIDYETTEDYVIDRTPTVSAKEMDTLLSDMRDELEYDEFAELEEEYNEAQAELQELLEETTDPETLELYRSLELERQQIYDNYYSMAETRMSIDANKLKNAEDSEDLLETLGYTSRTLRSGELANYEDDPDYVKMIVEDEYGTAYVNYVKTSAEEMVVVDERANTVTTFDYSGVNTGNSGARMFRSSRSGESGDKYADAINSVNTAFGALSATVEAEIERTKGEIAKVESANLDRAVKDAVTESARNRLSFLSKINSKYLPYIGNLLNIGSLWSDYNDRQVALQNREDAIKEYDDIVSGRDKRTLKDPSACLKALLALAEAYQNLADAIGSKILSTVTQLVAGLGSIAALIPTGGWSALFGLATWLAGLAVDKALDYMVNQYKLAVKDAIVVRDKACETYSRPREREITPIWDPSGYVYEAVPSNRVEGVTTTTYYQGSSNEPVLWDAENYGQENPLITTPDGKYHWDVPTGNWKVTYEKVGYAPQDSVDIYDWLPVLPIQTEVHVPLESTAAPAVASAHGYSDSIQLTFSQYMKEETLAGMITVTQGDEVLSGDDLKLSWLNSEYSDLWYKRSFASILQITRADGTEWKSGPATITVNGGKNYVDTALAVWTQDIDIIPAPREIRGSASLGVKFSSTSDVTLTIVDSHGDPLSNIPVELTSHGIVSVEAATAVTDANGQVTFTVSGDYIGEDLLIASVMGHETELRIPVIISADGSSPLPIVPDEPVVTINGTDYSGQGNTVTVEEGTVIHISGDPGDTLYYSIGENSCPCEDEQILIEYGQITITEGGYYKFAAFANGQYSNRVHITITVTEPEGGGGNEGDGNEGGGGSGSGGSTVIEPDEPIIEPPAITDTPFTDVAETSYYFDAVLWALNNNVTSGTSATTFGPNLTCTRAQAVTFLWNAAGKPEPKATVAPFTDVAPGSYYYKAVLWAVEQGITAGTSSTTFSPNADCTRAQIVTFLWNAAGKPSATGKALVFTDVPEAAYYRASVAWAVEQGITSGTSKTTFSPGNDCTRAQIVTFLWKYYAK